MADASNGSFWSSVPGMLSGAAALITAVGGIFLANQPNKTPDDPTIVQTTQSPECAIKGNISRTPEGHKKRYHMPDDDGYAATDIDTSKGERWFCSAVEAQQAGWERAQQQ